MDEEPIKLNSQNNLSKENNELEIYKPCKINEPSNLEDKNKSIEQKIVELSNQINEEEKINQSNNKIENITYYENLTLVKPKETIGLAEQKAFVVKMINENQKQIYKIYNENMEIATIDEQGLIEFSNNYIETLGKIDKRLLKAAIASNKKDKLLLPEKLEKNDKIMTNNEIKYLKGSKEQNQEQKVEDKETKENDDELAKVAKKAGIDKESITASSIIKPNQKVTDNQTFEEITNNQGKYTKIYVVNVNKDTKQNKRFAFMGITPDGNIEPIENLKTRGAMTTDKDIYSINRDGSSVKEKQTTEMFTTKDPNKMLSVTIGQYGILEVDYLRRDPSENKFIGSTIETNHERPTTRQVREFMNDQRNTKNDIEKSIDKTEKQLQENGSNRTVLNNIDKDETNDKGYDLDETIKLPNGDITTLRNEAQKRNISPDEYIKKIEVAKGNSTSEKIVNVYVEESKEEEIEDKREDESEWPSLEERLTPAEEAEKRMNNGQY